MDFAFYNLGFAIYYAAVLGRGRITRVARPSVCPSGTIEGSCPACPTWVMLMVSVEQLRNLQQKRQSDLTADLRGTLQSAGKIDVWLLPYTKVCDPLEPNSTTRTPATDTTNGQAHDNSTTNLQHRNARAQHLDMSRCWDVANFCPLVVFVAGVRSRCPCSGVWLLAMYHSNQPRAMFSTETRSQRTVRRCAHA